MGERAIEGAGEAVRFAERLKGGAPALRRFDDVVAHVARRLRPGEEFLFDPVKVAVREGEGEPVPFEELDGPGG